MNREIQMKGHEKVLIPDWQHAKGDSKEDLIDLKSIQNTDLSEFNYRNNSAQFQMETLKE